MQGRPINLALTQTRDRQNNGNNGSPAACGRGTPCIFAFNAFFNFFNLMRCICLLLRRVLNSLNTYLVVLKWRDSTNNFPACLTCGLYRLQPPLVQACFHGDAAELKILINRQEDVNYQVAMARRNDFK